MNSDNGLMLSYSLMMIIIFMFQILLYFLFKNTFAIVCAGFIFGLWLGNTLRWMFVK
jgi:hypothetical protein